MHRTVAAGKVEANGDLSVKARCCTCRREFDFPVNTKWTFHREFEQALVGRTIDVICFDCAQAGKQDSSGLRKELKI